MTTAPALPAPDLALSPRTGWTRAHWERTADALLDAVRPYADASGGLIHLPGPASGSGRWSDGLEGYARTFLLAAFRTGATPADATGAEAERAGRITEFYARGLTAGTDPGGTGRWPRLDEVRQARVEAASVALALHETRHLLWDRLPDAVRERTVDWLGGIRGAEVPDNNWVWFRAVVSAFLRSVGAPHSQADIDYAISRTEEWYAGSGWYTDGARQPGERRNYDYYNAWAMHLYPLWFCRISGAQAPPGLADRYRDRLRTFLDDAAHLVGGDGAPLFQGRSLTYRFAAAAPFWSGALFDATPLSPGVTRRAASGMLRHFTEAGAMDGEGLLTLGWHGRFERIRQWYSGPASPYWASKGFVGLLLPPTHPVWTATEEPLPVERGDFVRSLPQPGWTVSGTVADGIVRVANHGTDHTPTGLPARDDPFYARISYTTRTAPELSWPGLDEPDPDPEAHPRDGDARDRTLTDGSTGYDGCAVLLDAEGRPSHRSPLTRVASGPVTGSSRGRAHWPPAVHTPGHADRHAWPSGPWLTTASVLHGPWEVRLVRADGDAWEPRPRLRVGGHAVSGDAPPTTEVWPDRALVRRPDGLTSAVLALDPALEASVHRAEHTGAFGPYSAVPYLQTAEPMVYGTLYAVAVLLSGAAGAAAGGGPGEPSAPAVLRSPDAPDCLTVRWPDGTAETVTLPPPRE